MDNIHPTAKGSACQAEGASAYDIRKTEANIQSLQKKLAAQQGKLQSAERTPTLQALAEKTRSRLPQESTTAENTRKNVLDISEAFDRIKTNGGTSGKQQSVGNNVDYVKCRNEKLEGKHHPVSGVPFERKQLEAYGRKIEVVAPKFVRLCEVQLHENMLTWPDRKQFKECNRQLREAISTNADLRAQFTEEQIAQIEEGQTPDGYTWHHDAEPGKMLLVERKKHEQTGHTGGRNFWGGGTNYR